MLLAYHEIGQLPLHLFVLATRRCFVTAEDIAVLTHTKSEISNTVFVTNQMLWRRGHNEKREGGRMGEEREGGGWRKRWRGKRESLDDTKDDWNVRK